MTPRLSSLLKRIAAGGSDPVCAQHQECRADLAPAARLPEVRFDAAVHLRRSRRRKRGSFSRRARSSAFGGGCVRDRRSQTFPQAWQVIGENCRALGFNTDFAPVLDLAFEASRSVMSSRSVSANPARGGAYAREFLAGLRAAGVLGCGKHFPGLGEGKLDSHHELPVIEKPLKKLWAEDLVPYRMLRAQLPMVMISHAAYPQVTHDRLRRRSRRCGLPTSCASASAIAT
jgi:beta-glucosidase-like glycosyl hydrolase